MMRIACPFCNTHIDVDPRLGGTETNCSNCQGRFQIPVPPASIEKAYTPPPEPVYGAHVSLGPNSPAVRDFANKKIAAGICGILLGALGIHKFVLGLNTAGTIMLATYLVCFFLACLIGIPILGCFAVQVIGLIEGILYLTKSDEEFYQTYAIERKEWF
jgi:TM2 domain-containing membrane protein YozV